MIMGDRLRALREEKKLSQGDIEKRTGLVRPYISRVENNHSIPNIGEMSGKRRVNQALRTSQICCVTEFRSPMLCHCWPVRSLRSLTCLLAQPKMSAKCP